MQKAAVLLLKTSHGRSTRGVCSFFLTVGGRRRIFYTTINRRRQGCCRTNDLPSLPGLPIFVCDSTTINIFASTENPTTLKPNFNPLMPKRYFCTFIFFIVFKKQMLQPASTDLFNPLVLKTHNSERQNLQFPLQIKPVKVS